MSEEKTRKRPLFGETKDQTQKFSKQTIEDPYALQYYFLSIGRISIVNEKWKNYRNKVYGFILHQCNTQRSSAITYSSSVFLRSAVLHVRMTVEKFMLLQQYPIIATSTLDEMIELFKPFFNQTELDKIAEIVKRSFKETESTNNTKNYTQIDDPVHAPLNSSQNQDSQFGDIPFRSSAPNFNPTQNRAIQDQKNNEDGTEYNFQEPSQSSAQPQVPIFGNDLAPPQLPPLSFGQMPLNALSLFTQAISAKVIVAPNTIVDGRAVQIICSLGVSVNKDGQVEFVLVNGKH